MVARAEAPRKAAATGKMTETLFRALTRQIGGRWQLVSFRGRGGGESRGIVDVLAIRKDHRSPDHPCLKRGDLFEIILVQLKGGKAHMPSDVDVTRLRAVAERYHATKVVLFEWRASASASHRTKYSELHPTSGWVKAPKGKVFP